MHLSVLLSMLLASTALAAPKGRRQPPSIRLSAALIPHGTFNKRDLAVSTAGYGELLTVSTASAVPTTTLSVSSTSAATSPVDTSPAEPDYKLAGVSIISIAASLE
jgi:hypothetical protein